MILCDYHIHSTYSDGKSTPEEIVLAAIAKGAKAIGFSDHSYTDFDLCCCMHKNADVSYIKEISSLKEKHKDKIEILCGIEQDYYSENSTRCYDYIIGSVHYLKVGDEFITVDESAKTLLSAADKYFGGDILSLCEEYYRLVAKVVQRTNCDIIGHFDLISKTNEKEAFFDENDPRYVAAWQKAADRLLEFKKPFEVNTGAISRGYKSAPYPSKPMVEYIKQKGGKFIFSSDSHIADTLCFKFDDLTHYLGDGAEIVSSPK